MKKHIRRRFLQALVCAALMPAPRAAAQEPFYKGKTVSLIVASNSGGRLRHLWAASGTQPWRTSCRQSEHRGAEHAGAGGVRGANHLYNVAAKDGTVIGIFDQAVFLGPTSRRAGHPRGRGEVQLGRAARRQQRRAVRLAHGRGEKDRGRLHASAHRGGERLLLAPQLDRAQQARRHEVQADPGLRRPLDCQDCDGSAARSRR